jgi:signal transduction histidine kinase
MRTILRGPQSASRSVVEGLAGRHGLDGVVVAVGDGILAESLPGDMNGGELIRTGSISVSPFVWTDGRRVMLAAAVKTFVREESLRLVAVREVGRDDLDAISAITGGPVALVDPTQEVVLGRPAATSGPTGDVPFGGAAGGWILRVGVRAADASRLRRDALRTAAGVGPLAVGAALIFAAFLAQRVSRPIRALAEKADQVSRQKAGAAFEVVEEPNEVKRLERAFERMLEGLDGSEQRRVSAERIAAWQEVAKRIAHEVKNPLSPIRLAAENLLRTRLRESGDLARAVEEEGAVILEEVESLRRLVDEFTAFARLPSPVFEPCDPAKIAMQSVDRISDRARRMSVEIHTDVRTAPEEISADADQLGRALRNVLDNALDAVESSARREIRVSVRSVRGRWGPMAEFEVMDSGEGLGAEARRRIFDPYFTTKGERGGSGLGMSIVYRIVTEHGGEALADGAVGRGTVITLRFPHRAATISG